MAKFCEVRGDLQAGNWHVQDPEKEGQIAGFIPFAYPTEKTGCYTRRLCFFEHDEDSLTNYGY
ncbi:MAG: hypothetical protein WCX22_07415 [Methanoregula sp.]